MKKAIAVVWFLLGSTVGLFCASGESTAQFWEVFGVEWKPAKGLKLEVEKQLRYEKTFTDMESDVTQVGIGYKLNHWLEVQADYRFTVLDGEKRNRLDGNIVLDWSRPAISVSNRIRLQNESVETSGNKDTELTFRDRVQVTFLRDRQIRPFAGGEIFLGLGEDGKSRNKFRLTGGLDYNVTKKVTLSLFYHFQRDLGEATNETTHIVAGRFVYSF